MLSMRLSVRALFRAGVLSFALSACQESATTDSSQENLPTAYPAVLSGLSKSGMPDSVFWRCAKLGGQGAVFRDTAAKSLTVIVPLGASQIGSDTVWLSLWTSGLLIGKVPYQLTNGALHCLPAAKTKDSVALALLPARDSAGALTLSPTLAELYAQRLLNEDPHFLGFPSNAPTGISLDSVYAAGILHAASLHMPISVLAQRLGLDSVATRTLFRETRSGDRPSPRSRSCSSRWRPRSRRTRRTRGPARGPCAGARRWWRGDSSGSSSWS